MIYRRRKQIERIANGLSWNQARALDYVASGRSHGLFPSVGATTVQSLQKRGLLKSRVRLTRLGHQVVAQLRIARLV